MAFEIHALSSEYKLQKWNTRIHHITQCSDTFWGDMDGNLMKSALQAGIQFVSLLS